MAPQDHQQTKAEFDRLTNMTPKELENWLKTKDSQQVGWTREGEEEAVGHQSGRRILELKHKKQANLTEDDYTHMHKVVGYIHRHTKQGGPTEDKEHSHWRYALMNWGHDPLK